MAPRIPTFLIPEPRGFDDPVKRAAAHTERACEAGAGLLGASAASVAAAAALGAAVPPVAAVLVAGTAVAGLLKMRARWAKDDPARGDFADPVIVEPRRLDTAPLDGPQVPRSYVQLIVLFESSANHLAATIESLEKSMGAAIEALAGDHEAAGASVRLRRDARAYAYYTSYVLDATAEFARQAATGVREWLPSDLAPTESRYVADALSPPDIGRLFAAGIGPEALAVEVGDEWRESSIDRLPAALEQGAETTRELASELRRWSSEDQGPERSVVAPILPPGLSPYGYPFQQGPGFSFRT